MEKGAQHRNTDLAKTGFILKRRQSEEVLEVEGPIRLSGRFMAVKPVAPIGGVESSHRWEIGCCKPPCATMRVAYNQRAGTCSGGARVGWDGSCERCAGRWFARSAWSSAYAMLRAVAAVLVILERFDSVGAGCDSLRWAGGRQQGAREMKGYRQAGRSMSDGHRTARWVEHSNNSARLAAACTAPAPRM